jgi:DNA-directed RNA polymerase subunit alpha
MIPPRETPVEELGLMIRATTRLKEAGVHTLDDLLKRSESKLYSTNLFSLRVMREIKETLAAWGLALRS